MAGKAWVFGDGVNTDVMAPGLYFKSPMEEMAKHCMEALDPDFASQVQPGDVVIGGANFGVGSAREQAALAFKHHKVSAILAPSFGRIFYRNALNFGVPVLSFAEYAEIHAGDQLTVDPINGRVTNHTQDREYSVAPIPEYLMDMITAGGLMPWLKQRLAAGE
ncbi:MAG: 3-isopropylmalate dehydratase [Gammaproteobacteria bacterium]|nr:3-isopropylmalate dehydratase [Gammaproteobacteria bacterium]